MSGKALIAKQQASQTGNSPILQNFDYTQAILNNLIVEIIRRKKIYSLDEILEIVDADEMIDGQMMEDARATVTQELEQRGIKLPEHPAEIDPEAMQLDQSYAQNYLADLELMQKFNTIIDKLARPIAMDMLYKEISNLTKGRYNSAVTMSPYSPTMRIAEMAGILEISEILLKTAQPPIPFKRVIMASDISDKEEIIKEMEAGQQSMKMAMAKAG